MNQKMYTLLLTQEELEHLQFAEKVVQWTHDKGLMNYNTCSEVEKYSFTYASNKHYEHNLFYQYLNEQANGSDAKNIFFHQFQDSLLIDKFGPIEDTEIHLQNLYQWGIDELDSVDDWPTYVLYLVIEDKLKNKNRFNCSTSLNVLEGNLCKRIKDCEDDD